MLRNYLKTGLRNLFQNKSYGFLNIAGLAVGIAAAALIFLWVEDELTYNRHHQDFDRIYTVKTHQAYDGSINTSGGTPGLLAVGMQQDIPGVAVTARTDWGSRKLFSLGDKALYEEGLYMDSSFFKIFDFPFLHGNALKPFNQLNSIVISRRMAEKFFQDAQSAYGKSLKMDNKQEYVISGVFENLPQNSSFSFDWAAPYKLFEDRNEWLLNWSNIGVATYVKLEEKAEAADINARLQGYIADKDNEAIAEAFLFPISDWRLYSKFEDGKQAGGRIEYVRLFSAIAWIVLIIACINFMNLATARSQKRAKEIGVRKVLGAGKSKLVLQFLTEAVLYTFIAVLLSVGIIYLFLDAFNSLVEKELSIRLADPVHIAWLLVIGLICGLISGSYPALYLSSFTPVKVLKGLRISGEGSADLIRKGLVVSQFAVSIVLIVCTLVIYKQLEHVKGRELGYDKEQLIYMSLKGKMNERFGAIQQSLLSSGVVQAAAVSNQRVLQIGNNGWGFDWQGKDPNQKILITTEWVSHGYIKTLGMNLKSGRDFKSPEVQDSTSIIVNESFARLLGKEDVVGEMVSRDGSNYQIVGVISDFVYSDMYASADPLILFAQPSSTNYLFARLKQGVEIPNALAKVEAVLKTYNPDYPFEYKFMDEEFDKLFKSEMLIGRLSRIFSFLAIFISCLGLFGLAAYTAERRTKEIGIRKVLGASVAGITGLLSKDFLKLIFIAILIAFPVAWYFMNSWLQDFAYRITISWPVFLVAGLSALLIALLTISYQAIRAALANPVRNLHSE